ncbi:MAG: HAMP domain-containing histidine kinase, partial [Euryarchaeota archaeon]|nr:HAMP domain-containing histidine kinase [Euryarchaeota archaeon]
LESFVSSGTGLRPFRVREIIDKVLHAYSVSFSVEGDCTIMADEAFLSVIDNLVRNAIVHGKTERIEVKIASYGTGCEVRIADFGEGVPDKIKGKLFAEGFSYGEHRGSGLGLYLVKKTMERYGGSVTIEDNNPRGSIFILQSVVAPQENS